MAELTVAATLENLDAVTDFINGELEHADCPMKLITQVDLAVEEIYVNIAHYAYHPEIGEATVHCQVGGDPLQVKIGFADRGRPYNPLNMEDPDITVGLEERQVGGLGVFLAKNLMDNITYEFRDGKNILTISKLLEKPGE